MDIENRLKTVDNLIKSAVSRVKSAQNPVKLIAVSKFQPQEKVIEALEAGQRLFGENQLQDALARWQPLKGQYKDVKLHFIGTLQSKKATAVVEFFDAIHSIDRESLAVAVSKAMEKTGHRPECFVQVNTGEEAQKGGVLPGDAAQFIRRCREEWDLPVIGLMCIPPVGVNPVPHFALLKKLADENGLAELSMGMSDDWQLALRMGATHIRLGTAIFGVREAAG